MSQLILENARDLIESIINSHGFECRTHLVIEDDSSKNSVCYFGIDSIRRNGFIVWREEVKDLAYIYMDMNKYNHLEKEGFDQEFLDNKATIYQQVDSLKEFIEKLTNKATNTKDAQSQ